MEKTIKIQIKNSEVMQNSAFGGIQGEAQSRSLEITFDKDWEGLSKEITFFDAELKNPVKILLNGTNKVTDDTYSVFIPAKPLKTGGRFVYVIDGKKGDSVLKSITKSLKVHYSPDLSSAAEPESLTPDVVSQLNIAVQKNADEISANANEISANKEDIENIYNDLDTKKEKLTKLELNQINLNEKISANANEISANKEDIENIYNDLDTKKEKLTKLELNQINLNEKISANKNDITSLNNQKADKGTSLSEYGIKDAYTKTEVDTKHEDLQNQIYDAKDSANSAYGLASDILNIELVKKADKTELEEKADKPTVSYLGIWDGDISLIHCNNADIRYHSTPDVINFILADGEYDWLFTVGISFKTYATPPQISYTNSGLIQWVGTDCSLDNGVSLFIPSPDTQYDIVIYFNGSHFVGLVNGYKTATGNVVNE